MEAPADVTEVPIEETAEEAAVQEVNENASKLFTKLKRRLERGASPADDAKRRQIGAQVILLEMVQRSLQAGVQGDEEPMEMKDDPSAAAGPSMHTHTQYIKCGPAAAAWHQAAIGPSHAAIIQQTPVAIDAGMSSWDDRCMFIRFGTYATCVGGIGLL